MTRQLVKLVTKTRSEIFCSFCQNFAKLCGAPGFYENVVDRFCCFYIQTLFSVVPTRLVFWCITHLQQNEYTPGVCLTTVPSSLGFFVTEIQDLRK